MEMANLERIVGRKVHFENEIAPSKNMSPHVKVCRQKWWQLRCSAVGRVENLGSEKIIFGEDRIVLLLVLPRKLPPRPPWPSRIHRPCDGMSLCKNKLWFGMVKRVCSWFGQKLGIFLWGNKKVHFSKSALFFQPCTANMITYFQNALYFNDDIMIIDIIKRIKSSNVG